MIAWAKAISSTLNGFAETRETSLVRLFRTEYSQEYHWLKKQGTEIDDKFVKTYLSLR